MAANMNRRRSPRRARNAPEPTGPQDCLPGQYYRGPGERQFLDRIIPIKAACVQFPTANPWWEAVRAFTQQAGGGLSAAEAASLLSPYWQQNKGTAVQAALASQELQDQQARISQRRAASPRRASPRRSRAVSPAVADVAEPLLGLGGGAGQGYYGRRQYASYRGRSGSRSRSGSNGNGRNYQYNRGF